MSEEQNHLTVEKLKINERLLEVEKNQIVFNTIQTDCHSKICEIHTILMGSGTSNNPGMLIRIDRIEQGTEKLADERRHEDRRKTAHQNIVYASIAAVGAPQLWTFIKMLIGK